jgi:nicotinate-nucleotide adenylyltransferase
MKLGLFGGTFDPVHLGHLLMARAAREEISLDKIFFIPAAQSPFKTNGQSASAAQRLRMLRMALAGETAAEVDPQEINRGGVSYTIETVRSYVHKFPHAQLYYLIGADNAAQLPQWREAQELAGLLEFIIVPRPGETAAPLPSLFRTRLLSGFPLGVSSSQIRARLKAGLPIDHLVPATVAEAIRINHLYL